MRIRYRISECHHYGERGYKRQSKFSLFKLEERIEPANGVTGYKWVKKSEVTAFIFSCGDWTISLGVVCELFGLEKALVKLSRSYEAGLEQSVCNSLLFL